MSPRTVCGVTWTCVCVSWAQNPGWRRSGGFLVDTPSPGHEQLLCSRFVPDGGLKIHWWGLKPISYIASLSFLWVIVELSWCNWNLFLFVMDIQNNCWFFFSFPQHNWKYFFVMFSRLNLSFVAFCVWCLAPSSEPMSLLLTWYSRLMWGCQPSLTVLNRQGILLCLFCRHYSTWFI